MDRSAIHLVHKRGKSLRAIAAELGHSKTTIARVLSEPVDQRPAHRTRVSVVDRWRKQIAGWRATNGSCWNTSRPWPTCRFASKVCRASICKGIGARSATSNSAISHQPLAISHQPSAIGEALLPGVTVRVHRQCVVISRDAERLADHRRARPARDRSHAAKRAIASVTGLRVRTASATIRPSYSWTPRSRQLSAERPCRRGYDFSVGHIADASGDGSDHEPRAMCMASRVPRRLTNHSVPLLCWTLSVYSGACAR
jgi:hypothetical protein